MLSSFEENKNSYKIYRFVKKQRENLFYCPTTAPEKLIAQQTINLSITVGYVLLYINSTNKFWSCHDIVK